MFNITDTVQVLRDAESVITSTILNDDEKDVCLQNLFDKLLDRTPHGVAALAALTRFRDVYAAEKQRRETQRIEDAAKVAAESVKAPTGKTKGK